MVDMEVEDGLHEWLADMGATIVEPVQTSNARKMVPRPRSLWIDKQVVDHSYPSGEPKSEKKLKDEVRAAFGILAGKSLQFYIRFVV